jgi:hypothetical protein
MPFSYLLEPTGMSLVWPTRIRYSDGPFVYMAGKRRIGKLQQVAETDPLTFHGIYIA